MAIYLSAALRQRLVEADDRHLARADVFRYTVQHMWLAYPFYLLPVTPELRRLWNWIYRAFHDNRHRCARQPRPASATSETADPALPPGTE